ncbi:hypothetical protein JNUCC1_01133 [Lentibacillus sp. JNUCC-1]|nr:hypothetical protein [Lentibacillus sp. JNUCC-1]
MLSLKRVLNGYFFFFMIITLKFILVRYLLFGDVDIL